MSAAKTRKRDAEFLPAASGAGIRLFLCGFLILFLELALIRFLSGNIWNLGYFPNLVLLSAFVGLGAGFLAHERVIRAHLWFAAVPALVLALVGAVYVLRPGIPGFSHSDGLLDTELFWTVANPETDARWALFVLWFAAVAAIFALIAQFTAKAFRLFAPLTAYSLDIGGSLAGVAAFMLVSFLHIPASWWFVFCALLWAGAFAFGGGARILPLFGGVACFIVVALFVGARDHHDPLLRGESLWSPYQKVTYRPGTNNDIRIIYANNINHQQMHDREVVEGSFYSYIYNLRAETSLPPYKRVLVIGAGSGNDVAAALSHGAEFVHAVEIDPVIRDLGVAHHPMKPYESPRVSATIDDGRHALFAEAADVRYDLIIFALTDSLVKASAVSQLRLENYLFTEESLRRAWARLNDGGTLMLYNFYRRDWLVEKLLALVSAASGARPQGLQQGAFTIIHATKTGETGEIFRSELEIPTDDWPFLYLKERGVPFHYGAAIALLVLSIAALLAFVPVRRGGKPSKNPAADLRLRLAFVAMGGAFLLLETKSVVQFSLLFGTTWLNSAIVFFGALSLVLAANWTARFVPSARLAPLAFSLLGLSCLAVIVYPPANLVHWESAAARAVFASLLVFTPIYFANLVFAVLFRGRADAEKYFGWNLLGGTLGGAAEYAGMATGYHTLAWVVLACYAAVFLCVLPEMKKGLRDLPPPPLTDANFKSVPN